jgi:hypothetical protein
MYPAARQYAAFSVDPSGSLTVFGGDAITNARGADAVVNDMWRLYVVPLIKSLGAGCPHLFCLGVTCSPFAASSSSH